MHNIEARHYFQAQKQYFKIIEFHQLYLPTNASKFQQNTCQTTHHWLMILAYLATQSIGVPWRATVYSNIIWFYNAFQLSSNIHISVSPTSDITEISFNLGNKQVANSRCYLRHSTRQAGAADRLLNCITIYLKSPEI